MGDVNFFGSFPAAHNVGDPGGDMVVSFEGDTRNIPSGINEWYVNCDVIMGGSRVLFPAPFHLGNLNLSFEAMTFLLQFSQNTGKRFLENLGFYNFLGGIPLLPLSKLCHSLLQLPVS